MFFIELNRYSATDYHNLIIISLKHLLHHLFIQYYLKIYNICFVYSNIILFFLVSAGKMIMSESDSDSDVLFESRKCKQNGDARNGHGKTRNGFVKMGRRIKT